MIHPTAIIHKNAHLEPDVTVGPFAIIEEGVHLASGVKIGPRAVIHTGSILQENVQIFAGAVVGGDPQDLKYKGAASGILLEPGVIVREYCTLNKAVEEGEYTQIGARSLLMAYVHVGHDCKIENDVVLANRVQLGGHVYIGHHTVLGGCAAVHQKVYIGAYTFVGGTLKVDRDILVGTRALGDPLSWAGLNYLGLRRATVSDESIVELKKIHQEIYLKEDQPLVKKLSSLSTSFWSKDLTQWQEYSQIGLLAKRV